MSGALGLVSVVVPYRRCDAGLAECVESILAQDYPREKFELVLVDNKSAGDLGVLEKFKGRIRVVREGRVGYGWARNRGIDSSRGEIIAFLDSDCVAGPGWLRNLAGAFEDGDSMVVAGETIAYKPTTDVEAYYSSLISNGISLKRSHPYAGAANMAFRRKIPDVVGRFDTKLGSGEDLDFCWRLQEKGFRIVYEPGAVVCHRNVRSAMGLFRKVFVQGFYAVCCVKKNLSYLEREKKLSRVQRQHWLEVASGLRALMVLGIGGLGRLRFLRLVMLLGRKTGLVFGSVRFRFLYV